MALNVLLFPPKSVLYIRMAYGVFAREPDLTQTQLSRSEIVCCLPQVSL